MQHLSAVALVVRDYDEAIAFYVGTLGFDLVEDTRLSDSKRWVLVAPPGSQETRLLLQEAEKSRDALKQQMTDEEERPPSLIVELEDAPAVTTPELDARIGTLTKNLDEMLLRYTDNLAPEAEIAAAVEAARGDFDPEEGAA